MYSEESVLASGHSASVHPPAITWRDQGKSNIGDILGKTSAIVLSPFMKDLFVTDPLPLAKTSDIGAPINDMTISIPGHAVKGTE